MEYMNKKLLAFGIILVFLMIGLCGCNDTKDENNIIPTYTLNGWYYLKNYNCTDIDNQLGAQFNFFIETYQQTRTIRLIASSYPSKGINIGLWIKGYDYPIHTFETSDFYLDELYTLENNGTTQDYLLYDLNENTNVTLLEYYSNLEINPQIIDCGIPRKYL